MADYLEWPRDYLPPRNFKRGYVPFASSSVRRALSGRLGNRAGSSRAEWQPEFQKVRVSHSKRAAWWTLEGLISGDLLAVLVPYYHMGYYPKAGDVSEDFFDDDSSFDDGSGFVTTGTHVVVQAAAQAGATTIKVTKVCAGTILVGHVFSIGLHQYQVEQVIEQSDSDASLSITPGLRADVYPRDEVDFVFPAVKSRLFDPVALSLDWQRGRYAIASSIRFVEDTSP